MTNLFYHLAPVCDWNEINARRHELIDKSIDELPLTEAEAQELDNLQRFLDIYVGHETEWEQAVQCLELQAMLESLERLKQYETANR